MKRYDSRTMYMLMVHMTDAPLGFIQFEIKKHEVRRIFQKCQLIAYEEGTPLPPGEKTFIIQKFR